MPTRCSQIKHLWLIGLFTALVASAFTPTPPPKTTRPACESIAEVKLGEKGIISCTGFTPTGDVKVIFHRPDSTSSEDLGKADEYGNFDGTFTVALERPTGEWTLYLIDLSSGQMIATPFIVIPSVTVVPTATPVILTAIPVPTTTPVVPIVTAPAKPTGVMASILVVVALLIAAMIGYLIGIRASLWEWLFGKAKLDDKKVLTGLSGHPRDILKIRYGGELAGTPEGAFVLGVRNKLDETWKDMLQELGIGIIATFAVAGLKAAGGAAEILAKLYEKYKDAEGALDKIKAALEAEGWKMMYVNRGIGGLAFYNAATGQVQAVFQDTAGHSLTITYTAGADGVAVDFVNTTLKKNGVVIPPGA